ncbi:phospholipase [Streptomyces sp. ISL-96]|uniref:phospholipase n=1 Tax=Streptomyces sp. ISL-96 TaxID=2819191 RepID=UPI001BE6C254|nr:phospholipase [Streptomyces sp. ISL-96]MBT2491931.1 phospholipase [Streptomyces sp. ISL-96]
MRRRLTTPLTAAALALPLLLGLAVSPALAAPADKSQVLSGFTQTSASSYNAWFAARQNQSAWSAYGFDWSTDYCTTSPDNPFGFPFQNSCARHDFAYRNYKAAGTFTANKARLDDAFYADLKRVCANYSGLKKSSCDAAAWTYYRAVDEFGFAASTTSASRRSTAA